jgi:hypothetical protein
MCRLCNKKTKNKNLEQIFTGKTLKYFNHTRNKTDFSWLFFLQYDLMNLYYSSEAFLYY